MNSYNIIHYYIKKSKEKCKLNHKLMLKFLTVLDMLCMEIHSK